jgi:predicted permease
MVIFTISISLSSHIRWNDASFGALVAAFPNTGFMGIPLLVALFGQAAAGPAIVTILADMFITTSLCIGLSRLDGAEEHGASRAIQKALKGVLANPMPWAIAAGCVVSAMQLQVPLPINATIGLLADAASPVALFTIGAVLARSTLLAQQDSDHSVEWIDFVPIALVASVPQVLVVNPKSFSGDFKAFLETVKKSPGKFNYGSAGGGTSHHLAGELFKIQKYISRNGFTLR